MKNRMIDNSEGAYIEIDRELVPKCIPKNRSQLIYLAENLIELVNSLYYLKSEEFEEYE